MRNSKIEHIRKIKDENNKLKRINDELNMFVKTQRIYISKLEQENLELKYALEMSKASKDLQSEIKSIY